ncbi:hypothetical protein XaFJ1_GM002508 [Xanthomonas albilineans]|nr:hypothetical protein XaFJ1_GM002508 [Xanthomonas albilineans]
MGIPAERGLPPWSAMPDSSAHADPRPQPPSPPAPGDCCDSGCPLCVHDVYHDELARYLHALAQWRLRHPEAVADG